ncbi:hypothetical protein [Chromobacterium sp. ASV23]|uniref:hypothetical protein n=1 Tax=Chromobacterium sp. ASV23 TaxID=2795110 RepID=UPI0018EDE600|nr:hypothetical protein [Chromobacterium sp. ASV23]
MTKILNLDAFAKIDRKVSLFGREYDVAAQTVGAYVEAQSISQKLAEASDSEQVEMHLRLLETRIVGIERATLERLTFPQISALTQFVNGIDDPVLPDDAELEKKDQGVS